MGGGDYVGSANTQRRQCHREGLGKPSMAGRVGCDSESVVVPRSARLLSFWLLGGVIRIGTWPSGYLKGEG
jgi:hypothetical protein